MSHGVKRQLWWLIAVTALCAGLAVALPPASDCQTDPWPYGKANLLRTGDALLTGGKLATPRAELRLSKSMLSLVRLMDTAVVFNVTFPSADAAQLTLGADGVLSVLASNGSQLWSANNASAPAAIAVVLDDCVFAIFQDAPMTHAVWTSGPPQCMEVHIVPHSHDDVGWLLTPERYYDGCHSTTGGGARGIYTTVVQALLQDANRTFISVEMYFFERWWQEQNETTRNGVRQLVQERRLVFINAGWSMHDEACVHQESAVSNMAIGNQFLKQLFGDLPAYDYVNVGWHIDPFGHASATPRLMAEMGFDSFWFWRPGDVQQHAYKLATRTQETVWLPSVSQGSKAAMFTSILYDSYCSGCGQCQGSCPGGFCCYYCEYDEEAPPQRTEGGQKRGGPSAFEYLKNVAKHSVRHQPQSSPQRALGNLIKGHETFSGDIKSIATAFAGKLQEYGWYFRTQHVLVPWGCDFMHNFALEDYPVMDAVIEYINAHYSTFGMRLFYSTPDRYVEAVNSANYSWPANVDDYFVYADYPHAYWSGYFSSRAEYKGFERMLMNERSTAEIVATSVAPNNFTDFNASVAKIVDFQRMMGVAQHHDSITGTERQHVRNRYQYLLTNVWTAADSVTAEVLQAQGISSTAANVSACRLANISACSTTQHALTAPPYAVNMAVVNSLSRARTVIVRVPVPTAVDATDEDGTALIVQLDDVWEMNNQSDPTSPWELPMPLTAAIQVALAPLQTKVITLRKSTSWSSRSQRVEGATQGSIENDHLRIDFDGNGAVTRVINRKTRVSSSLHERVGWYTPMPAGDGQASGAYIFRPQSSTPTFVSHVGAIVTTVSGPLCNEVRVVLNSSQSIQTLWRLCRGDTFAEVMLGAGPLDPESNGIELIHVVGSSDIRSNGTWYTDSEGLEIETRRRDQRPNYPYTVTEPIASNFFPCNIFSIVKDEASGNRSLTVIADRSRATASINDGELQFLVLRRLLYDDNRGVDQALDENIRLQSLSRVYFHGVNSLFEDVRFGALAHAHPPVVRFSALNPTGRTTAAGMRGSLPRSVALHSRVPLNRSSMLVRLQHLFATGEGSLGVPVTVDLLSALPAWTTPLRIVPTDLNGVVPLTSVERLQWRTCLDDGAKAKFLSQLPRGVTHVFEDGSLLVGRDGASSAQRDAHATSKEGGVATFMVELSPLDIKSFVVHFADS